MKTVQVSRRSASRRRVLVATGVLAVSYGIRGVNAAAWTNCPAGSADQGSASGYHECVVNNGYYLKSAGTDATGQDDAGIDIQLVPAGYWSEHASPIFLTTTTTTHVWDGTTDDDLGSGNAAATSGVTKCDVAFTNAIAGSLTTATTGSSFADDCVTKAGYYISDAGLSGDIYDATTALAPVGTYVAGGKAVKGSVFDDTSFLPVDCPFGGSSAAGSSALTDCTPDCDLTDVNSGAVASGGTCQCAAGYYGVPTDTNAATLAAAITGCTSCARGTTSTAGTTTVSGCTASTTVSGCTASTSSAGATAPIAVALAAAAAVPLLL